MIEINVSTNAVIQALQAAQARSSNVFPVTTWLNYKMNSFY